MVDLAAGRGKDDVRESEDTEITLGTGKLLGIFFGLVIICSLFFTLGYLLGHSTAASDKTEIIGTAPAGGSTAGKPSAVNRTAGQQPTPAPSATASGPSIPPLPSTSPSALPVASVAPADVKPATGGSITVQVAAVSKKEDADNLVTALSKKQYPVFVSTAPGDALFHVQVGPFSDPKDAETMRAKLAGEGYEAIVKR
jgi:cell division septation protein DedD